MATGIGAWSTLAATNSTADSTINWAEGQAPSTVNDSARALMAGVATFVRDGSWIQYQDQSHTVVSATSTKIDGRDLTAYYPANRRVRFVVGANTTYGRIAGTAFSTDTTNTYVLDNAGSLSATVYGVSVALATPDANPIGPSPRVADSMLYFESSLSSTAVPAQRIKVMAQAAGFATGRSIQFNSSLSATFAASTALSSKTIVFTRDTSLASNSVAYTGIGFTPTSIFIAGVDPTTNWNGVGFADSALAGVTNFELSSAGLYSNNSSQLLQLQANAGGTNYTILVVASYDADGFTITYTKNGTPSGTASLIAICYK